MNSQDGPKQQSAASLAPRDGWRPAAGRFGGPYYRRVVKSAPPEQAASAVLHEMVVER